MNTIERLRQAADVLERAGYAGESMDLHFGRDFVEVKDGACDMDAKVSFDEVNGVSVSVIPLNGTKFIRYRG